MGQLGTTGAQDAAVGHHMHELGGDGIEQPLVVGD